MSLRSGLSGGRHHFLPEAELRASDILGRLVPITVGNSLTSPIHNPAALSVSASRPEKGQARHQGAEPGVCPIPSVEDTPPPPQVSMLGLTYRGTLVPSQPCIRDGVLCVPSIREICYNVAHGVSTLSPETPAQVPQSRDTRGQTHSNQDVVEVYLLREGELETQPAYVMIDGRTHANNTQGLVEGRSSDVQPSVGVHPPQPLATPPLEQEVSPSLPALHAREESPLYVNAKQYSRILRRRQQRAELEAQGRVPRHRQKYAYESRHRHALSRQRSSQGQFVSSPGVRSKTQDAEGRSRERKSAKSASSPLVFTFGRRSPPLRLYPPPPLPLHRLTPAPPTQGMAQSTDARVARQHERPDTGVHA